MARDDLRIIGRVLLAPILLPFRLAFIGCCAMWGIDWELASLCPRGERWTISAVAALSSIGFTLNCGGLHALFLRVSSDWHFTWGLPIAIAAVFAIMNALWLSSCVRVEGARIVTEQRGGAAHNAAAVRTRIPIYRLALSSLTFGFVAFGLALTALSDEVAEAWNEHTAAVNAYAIEQTTADWRARRDHDLGLRDQRTREAASLAEIDRQADREKAHPELKDAFAKRERLAEVDKAIVKARADYDEAERRTNCEIYGGGPTRANGCSSTPGEKRRAFLAESERTSAENALSTLSTERQDLLTSIANTNTILTTLRRNADEALRVAQQKLDDTIAAGEGEAFQRLVREQPTFRRLGFSLPAQGDALIAVVTRSVTAAVTTIGLITLLVLFDLGPLQLAREARIPVYSEAAHLLDEATREANATLLGEQRVVAMENGEDFAGRIAEILRRRRDRAFTDAVAEAHARMHRDHVASLHTSDETVH